MQKTLMEMAVPSGLKVSFFTVEESVAACKGEGAERTLLLFSSPSDVLSYVRKGGAVSNVNVGGMHFCEGKRQVAKTVCVSGEDVAAFQELNRMGLELEIRAVPGDAKESLGKYLSELKVKK
jgi:mannose/fructose/N-acetylgalactosamine-specific phosphotransferase system component IIB